MSTKLFWSVIIYFLGTGPMDAKDARITQSPRHIVTRMGQEVTLKCEQNLGHNAMYWYRQDLGQGLQLIYYSPLKDDIQKGDIPEGYNVTREKMELFHLILQSSRINQTSLYLCASSGHETFFGPGTKLIVVDDLNKVIPPKVTVFQPSEEEIEEKGKATLVCLATGFYPDLVELSWWVNGQETKVGVSTDLQPSKEQPNSNFSKYSLSSRLRVSAPFWRNPKNSFRCQVLFHGISEDEPWTSNMSKPITQNVSDQIWGKADCGVSSESYQQSIQSATFFYEILLGKAMLYGLLVSALLWRTMAKKKNS